MKSKTDAFRAMYDADYQRVRSLLVRMVGPQEAEDLTQVVFAKAAKALPTFRGESQTSTWLYRIAISVASDWLRSRSTHEARLTVALPDASNEGTRAMPGDSMFVDSQPSPEATLARKDTSDCIRGEIGKLPDDYRIVLMLSMLGGLTDGEIAHTLGISHGNAKVRLHRARQEFKKMIETRCDFYRTELSCKPTASDCCTPTNPPEKPGTGTNAPL